VHEYQPGSWGPQEADRLAEDVGGWINPKGEEALRKTA
jgi:glucose-6-phosphate 1-dehydrogenase